MVWFSGMMSVATPVLASPVGAGLPSADLTDGLSVLGYAGLGLVLAALAAILVAAARDARSHRGRGSEAPTAAQLSAPEKPAQEQAIAA